MDWFLPSQIASLTITVMMVLVYCYLYLQDSERFLAIWAASWAVYALRFVLNIIAEIEGGGALIDILESLANLSSGVLLLWGTQAFLNRRMPKGWHPLALACALWIIYSALSDLPFLLQTLPTFLLLGGIYIWTGLQLLRSRKLDGLGKYVAAWAFILWGVHKLDYPVLRPFTGFAPWGFLIAAVLCQAVALGMILVYLQFTRQELRLREARARAFSEMSSDYMYIFHLEAEGNPVLDWISDSFSRLTGYSRADLQNLPQILSVAHPDELAGIRERLARLHSGESVVSEMRLTRKDGGEMWVRNTTRTVEMGPDGKAVSFYSAAQDITDQKRAESMLLEQNLVLQQSEAALAQKSAQQERIIATASRLAESLDLRQVLERIGREAKEILGSYGCVIYILEADGKRLVPVVSFEPPDDDLILATPLDVDSSFTGQAVLARRGLIFNDAGESEVGFQIPGTAVEPEERVIAVPFISGEQVLGAMCLDRIGTNFKDEELALAEMFAAFATVSLKNAQDHDRLQREVAERRRAEEALRESEERYRQAVENSPNPIFSVDRQGIIHTWNGSCARVFGYDGEVVGTRFTNIIANPAFSQKLEGSLAKVLDGQTVNDIDILYRCKDGQLRQTVSRLYPLLSASGKVNGCVFANTDITERMQREREMEAVVSVATALRAAQTRTEMAPIIVSQVRDLLQANRVALALHDPASGENVVELSIGQSAIKTGQRLSAGEGITGLVIQTGRPYVTHAGARDPHIIPENRGFTPAALAGVPLVVKAETIGALLVGRDVSIGEAEMRVLTAIAEIAASAIRRASLFEETQRRLRRLNALHAIDKAITTNLDLHGTLQVALDQVIEQLQIAASVVLRYERASQKLLYEAGLGFRSKSVQNTALSLGQSYAGIVAQERRTLLVPDLCADQNAPPGIRSLAKREGFRTYVAVPLLAHDELQGTLEIFHRSTLTVDQEWWDFLDTLARQIAIAIDNACLFKDLQNSNLELTLAYDTTLEGWAKALELRDKETQGHSQRVTDMTLRLARAMGIGGEELVHVRRGALLHDIGKMGVPDNILLKAGPLDEDEWRIMHQHPVYSRDLLANIPYLQKSLEIPYCHHERWDGSGYPLGLKGEEIPLAARVFAVIDVWDALLNERPYRAPWPEDRVRAYLVEQAGQHFDPRVVDAFLKLIDEDGAGGS